MAILVAVGGAALGSVIGVGWQAGWLVGSVVGGLLFPRKGQSVTTEGPRLGDLSVSSSAYGAAIAIPYRRAVRQPYQLIDPIAAGEGGALGSYQGSELAVDWRRGYGYFLASSSNADTAGLRRFSLRTMAEDRQARMSDVTNEGMEPRSAHTSRQAPLRIQDPANTTDTIEKAQRGLTTTRPQCS